MKLCWSGLSALLLFGPPSFLVSVLIVSVMISVYYTARYQLIQLIIRVLLEEIGNFFVINGFLLGRIVDTLFKFFV